MENIILIGMPGAGKSTVGVILAKIMGYEFVDSDLVIQREEKALLKDIIEARGVDGFIKVEERVNASLAVEKTVVATGGSVVYGAKAMEHLKSIGKIVYLKLSYETIDSRLNNIKGRGVVLRDGQTLLDLYHERVPLYEKYADIVIDEDKLNVEETVSAIIESFK